jgi:hypothetical protein
MRSIAVGMYLIVGLIAQQAIVISPLWANDDWQALFNGKDLTGWIKRGGDATFVVDETEKSIVGTTGSGPNTFLCTDRDYGDFELQFEVKVDPRLNSGVQIRSQSLPEYQDGVVHGYQVEIATSLHPGFSGGNAGAIWDESRGKRWLSDEKGTPAAAAAFKANQWNSFRVVCHADAFRTWVNGVPIADIRDKTTAKGFIALQVHSFEGDPPATVRWRNLRLRCVRKD